MPKNNGTPLESEVHLLDMTASTALNIRSLCGARMREMRAGSVDEVTCGYCLRTDIVPRWPGLDPNNYLALCSGEWKK